MTLSDNLNAIGSYIKQNQQLFSFAFNNSYYHCQVIYYKRHLAKRGLFRADKPITVTTSQEVDSKAVWKTAVVQTQL